jgi:uncharacterized protein YutE (UPF0331/DUF86 family)
VSSVTDPGVVFRRITSLREQVARMRRRRSEDRALFAADVDRQDALGMSLLVAVQDALDIALHIASDEKLGVPASYADAFALLESRGVIDAPLARQLAGMTALRNRIAHGYASVDMERLWSELPDWMEALARFSAAVAEYLGQP